MPRAGLVTETTRLITGDEALDGRRLALLLEAIGAVSSTLDPDRVLDSIVDKSIAVTGAERGLLLLLDGNEVRVRVARDARGRDLPATVQYSTTVVRRVLDTSEPIRSMVGGREGPIDLGQTVLDLRLRAVMCAPLRMRGQTIGVIYVDSRATTREFTKGDLAYFQALCTQIAIALENTRLHADSIEKARLEASLRLAGDIQRRLLPTTPPSIPQLELEGRFVPAEEASGDSYDFVALPDGRVAVIVGDASGHGVGPGLVTATARASLRTTLRLLPEPGEAVTRLNGEIRGDVEEGMFLTLFLSVFDPAARTLHYVNAGHPEALVRRRDGALERLDRRDIAIGFADDVRYSAVGPIPFSTGDLFLAFTDGLVEARPPGGEPFGMSGLESFLRDRADLPAARLLDDLIGEVTRFAGGKLDDDLTLVAVRGR